MQKFLLAIVLLFTIQSAMAQAASRTMVARPYSPKVKTIFCRLGDRTIQVKTYQYSDAKDIICINLHDDEITSVNGAKKLLEKRGGMLIKIENYLNRNIRFRLEGKYYTFDPNRMFSRAGIAQTLTLFGRVSNKAIEEVERFAARILQQVPADNPCVIALHNNSNGKFSINSYLPGNVREKDAKALYVNPEEDPDDIYLTTDSVLFVLLSNDKYNTVLQDNINAKKDGSLSIYCGENGIRYVNCETEHGRDMQYQQMIILAAGHIERNPAVTAYNYKILAPKGAFSPGKNTELMFGEKKVGAIRSVMTDSNWATFGRLDIDKDFPLYTNMDFYFLLSALNSPRFEIRIDPTREKELIDPAKTIVSVKAIK